MTVAMASSTLPSVFCLHLNPRLRICNQNHTFELAGLIITSSMHRATRLIVNAFMLGIQVASLPLPVTQSLCVAACAVSSLAILELRPSIVMVCGPHHAHHLVQAIDCPLRLDGDGVISPQSKSSMSSTPSPNRSSVDFEALMVVAVVWQLMSNEIVAERTVWIVLQMPLGYTMLTHQRQRIERP